jgi:hypothetical protein
MLKAFKDLNAPDDLVNAYKEQYRLLGLMPADGNATTTTPSNTPAPSPAPTGTTTGANNSGTPSATPSSETSVQAPAGTATSPASSANIPTEASQGHTIGQIVATDPAKYDNIIQDAIQKYGNGVNVDPNIIKGMIWQESKGDPLAVGSLDAQGSKGLLQVTALNAQTQGFGNQFDPVQSIGLGVKMYADALRNNNGDVAAALGEYNQGPGGKTNAAAQTYAQNVQEWAAVFAQGPGNLPEGIKPGTLE